jgi:AcrR family transcriptional regulator
MSPRKYRKDKRLAAVEETRRRIVEATMALHGEQGILATSWEDIARRADVSVATVYRHFPSLDELVPACGALTNMIIQPPKPEAAPVLFADISSLTDRVERLVHEFCAFYERAAPVFIGVRRESHLLSALQEWLAASDATRETFVREALQPIAPDEQTIQVITALTDFPVWQALIDRGVSKEVVTEVIKNLVLCSINKAPPAKLAE